MKTKFTGASIWSEDLNNLVPFYRDVLGLTVMMESPNYVVFGSGPNEPDQPWLGIGTHSEVRGRNQDAARHMVGLNSEDIHAEWQRLKEAGVEFVEEPTLYEDLWIATLKDPEGNLVQLFDYRPNPA
jgi:predicted enzyme related to lactoylglutathione lyase